MVLPFRLSFPSILPTIVLSFPLGAEPAVTHPGIDPSAAVIPITYSWWIFGSWLADADVLGATLNRTGLLPFSRP
jgi:hypothetical protein